MSGLRWWHGRRRYWEAGVELGYKLGKESNPGEQGRCGNRPPVLIEGAPIVACDLPWGHNGWHRSYDLGGPAPQEWSA